MGHNVSKSSAQVIAVQSAAHNGKQSNVNNLNNKVNGPGSKESDNGYKNVSVRNVKTADDTRMCDITGCIVCKQTVLVVTDYTNRKLKKCNKDQSVDSIPLPCAPSDVCNHGSNNNEVVVSGDRMLCYVNTSGHMKILRTVNLHHECLGVTCHDDTLYVIDTHNVFVYTLRGRLVRTLYTDTSSATKFHHIAVNDTGTLLYISLENSGLFTIQTTDGHVISKFENKELLQPQGVCVTDNGNILISGFQSDNVIELDQNGGEIIRTLIQNDGYINDPKCLCYNRHSKELTVGQWDDSLIIFKL